MAVKILHAADFHMDSAFDALPADKAAERRREQRALLDRIADLCESEHVQLVLLAGDLLDSAASYYETHDALLRMLERISVPVFLAPGNHDYFCPKSPYAFLEFPKYVHVFRTPEIRFVDVPELDCRVYGAGYGAAECPSLLGGFSVADPSRLNLMVMHGDMASPSYAPFSESDVAASGLDYLALGHVHTFSGIRKAGSTCYAYPGCIEGRGFDETGKKGVILGTVDKGGCELRFVPLGGREYKLVETDVTGCKNPAEAAAAALSPTDRDAVCRVILKGECGAPPDLTAIRSALERQCYSLSLRDETRLAADIWDGCGDDTLRGLFLKRMKAKYDEISGPGQRNRVLAAARYGLAAFDGREEWRA